MFSGRLNWNPAVNRITRRMEALEKAGIRPLDLTVTNPTACGLDYDGPAIRAALSLPSVMAYHPNPRGLLPARQAVSDYYGRFGRTIDPETVFLTASTSESYAMLFKLLCDPGDDILVPSPSYPLFDFLAALESVRPVPYPLHLHPETGWSIDPDGLFSAVTGRTRAVILVSPNNPTGSYVRPEELEFLTRRCAEKDLALIADEVFLDFASKDYPDRPLTTAGNTGALTFTLSGISKVLGLPQLKLGWIQVGGPPSLAEPAMRHLETICDTYLSVSAPVQEALPSLMAHRTRFQSRVLSRLEANETFLKSACQHLPAGRMLPRQGGWSAVLAMQNGISDEDMVCRLLDMDHVLIQPGYFYDFSEESCLILSLLTPPDRFRTGIDRLVNRFSR